VGGFLMPKMLRLDKALKLVKRFKYTNNTKSLGNFARKKIDELFVILQKTRGLELI
jgi:hypothetical protein